MALIFVAFGIFLLVLDCKRYPNEKEIRDLFADESAGRTMVVDSDQGEIGLFGISIGDDEKFFLEAIPKWVFPWEDYYESAR